MTTVSGWDDDYARLARAASQLRTTSKKSQQYQQHPAARESQIRSIEAGLVRLNATLPNLGLNENEVVRRKNLIDNLGRNLGGSPAAAAESDLLGLGEGGGQQQQRLTLSNTGKALRQQDAMIEELATGVSRLKDTTYQIHDEAGHHNRLLDEMERNVNEAQLSMEAETARAAKLKEDNSVWRLYLIIAGLSLLLFMLILAGLS